MRCVWSSRYERLLREQQLRIGELEQRLTDGRKLAVACLSALVRGLLALPARRLSTLALCLCLLLYTPRLGSGACSVLRAALRRLVAAAARLLKRVPGVLRSLRLSATWQ